jgi:glycerate 2-kinase
MARAFAELEPGVEWQGLIAGPPTDNRSIEAAFEWFDAGHPSPNDASVAAGRRALALAHESHARDAGLLVLLSGGGSAMLTVPAGDLLLEDKIAAGRALMNAGLPIDRLNCVRRHLSQIKGGRLAAAAGRTVTLAISDVHAPVPDDPSVIGSGPTVPDPTTFAEALDIVRGVPNVPERVLARLQRGARGELAETVKPGDPRLVESVYEIVANRLTALEGARQAAEKLGYCAIVLNEITSGESREAARTFVARARREAGGAGRPACVLAAGETTVTVAGMGLGGRNQEFALAAAPDLATFGSETVLASMGTDGIDGPTDAAGAIVDSTTLARAARVGLDRDSTLAANDAYHFFRPLGDLVGWGPTGTNVGDVQLLLIA